ncbi:PadR family transcriptional regulator [Natrinema pallidum]|uniref:Transcriptional regulator PadR family protein n=1 Tax=Natrinema pallidum DSM 3751 TaxID=1227495 RepID=L9ZB03_9EURY|nr:PadR family transcriptional regulator [Natrinema pallidum]ELY82792.1 transcriptional regulator PadR family protein [Natrinema pallidum DSM 3751]
MSDDDSRDHERPARAVASFPDDTPDGRRAWVELSGFQRDCLEAVARRARDGYPCYASGIARTLERRYPTVSRARVKPGLRILADRGYITSRDGLTGHVPAYRLTDTGRALLIQRAERLATLCELGREPTDAVTAASARATDTDRAPATRDEDRSSH